MFGESKFNPEVRKQKTGFVFSNEIVKEALVSAMGDIRMQGKLFDKVCKSIPAQLYQGGSQQPQMFYWLDTLKIALKNAGLSEQKVNSIIMSFQNEINRIKYTNQNV